MFRTTPVEVGLLGVEGGKGVGADSAWDEMQLLRDTDWGHPGAGSERRHRKCEEEVVEEEEVEEEQEVD